LLISKEWFQVFVTEIAEDYKVCSCDPHPVISNAVHLWPEVQFQSVALLSLYEAAEEV
jgi:hypothetical protein